MNDKDSKENKLTQEQKEMDLTREKVFAMLNESAEKTLKALENAYQAGLKEGMTEQEEDKVLELLRRAKQLRDKVSEIGSNKPPISPKPKN